MKKDPEKSLIAHVRASERTARKDRKFTREKSDKKSQKNRETASENNGLAVRALNQKSVTEEQHDSE